MKKTFYFIGSALYGLVFSYLLWLAFYCLTPFAMSFGWFGLIVYWILCAGLIPGIIGGAGSILFVPLNSMLDKCNIAKWLPILSLCFFGYSSAALPWSLDIDYSMIKIIIGFSLSITATLTYIGFIFFLFNKKRRG